MTDTAAGRPCSSCGRPRAECRTPVDLFLSCCHTCAEKDGDTHREPTSAASGCTDEHAKFCSACTTARLYNSIHCQDCPEGRPSAATTTAAGLRRCPRCNSVNLNMPTSTMSTLMGHDAFQDERGRHWHDPNSHTSEWSCRDCGVRFAVTTWTSCPSCDYNNGPEEVSVRD